MSQMKEYEVRKEISGYVRGHKTAYVYANSEEEAIDIAKKTDCWGELDIIRDDTETQDIWCL
ncbi:hypothetical protein [Aeromonas phage AS-sw]|uniref:Uncharacterized protein n=2 Tax=Ceceduovirus TaxID=2842588 RepID=A0A291LD58_9CAUD|nr:hypothetical protein HWB29_gp117 [Aeromonas phage AS-sw]ATI17329.1 hypothetical protein [Aeromonas phage AS-szw]ATI18167.1 hypothetical protein [Aeromonas phage AS-sw]QMV28965.1 hypothetical protein AP1_0258 [Aeromonas phage AP1]